MQQKIPLNFDNKYLIAYLCNAKKSEDFMILLEFYRFLNNLIYKTKDYNLYQIKLKWLMDEVNSTVISNVLEIDNLKLLIDKYYLDKDIILAMIETKTIDMDNFPFNSQLDLLGYIEKTDVAFWVMYAKILYGNSLNDVELENIKNMARAFGILELIRFAHYKKSKNIYVLLYSQGDINKEKENIKNLLSLAKNCIKKSSKNKGKLKRLLLLNNLSKNFINQLKKVDYKIDHNSISNVSKITYLKIILSLIFKL